MPSAREILEERSKEIAAYLNLLHEIEHRATSAIPRIEGATEAITPQQKNILYAAVYMHLYNLVEAVATKCIDSVSDAAASAWQPGDLSDLLRKEWVRFITSPYEPLSPESRHKRALELCLHLVNMLPIKPFKIEKSGGSWHDKAVHEISRRLGLKLDLSRRVRQALNTKYKNDMGPLKYIKEVRNSLAHGSISFEECGRGATVSELRDLTDVTVSYLTDVVSSFEAYIANHEFLQPARRPIPQAQMPVGAAAAAPVAP